MFYNYVSEGSLDITDKASSEESECDAVPKVHRHGMAELSESWAKTLHLFLTPTTLYTRLHILSGKELCLWCSRFRPSTHHNACSE